MSTRIPSRSAKLNRAATAMITSSTIPAIIGVIPIPMA